MQAQISYAGTAATDGWLAQGSAGSFDELGMVVVSRANQEIFGTDDPANYCYKVLGGCVRIVKLIADGRRQILEFLLPGDFFGFDSLGQHHASAEAITRTTLLRYPRRRIDALVETDPSLARMVRKMVSTKLEAAHRSMLSLGRKSADERIASFLLELADRQTEAASTIDLHMSRQDIADHLGLTLETVSRVLSRLKRRGLIDLPVSSHIRLLDREALEDLDAQV